MSVSKKKRLKKILPSQTSSSKYLASSHFLFEGQTEEKSSFSQAFPLLPFQRSLGFTYHPPKPTRAARLASHPPTDLARINYPVSDGAHPSAAMWTVSGDNQQKHMVLTEDMLPPQPRPPSKMLMLVARQRNPDAEILNGRLMRFLIGQRLGGRGIPLRTRFLSRIHNVLRDLCTVLETFIFLYTHTHIYYIVY